MDRTTAFAPYAPEKKIDLNTNFPYNMYQE